MKSTDYERDAVSLEHLPKPIISNATIPQTNTEEVTCSKIYLTELENQAMEAKMTELENWKKQLTLHAAQESVFAQSLF